MLIVRHRASGWVSEIARKDEDALIEAHFDPESGVVTVYEGRPEFKALERAARRAGLQARHGCASTCPTGCSRSRRPPTPSTQWAAEQIVARRLAGELRNDPVEYAHALRHEAQALRHRAHEKLMRAFLDPEVFSGGVRVVEDEPRRRADPAQRVSFSSTSGGQRTRPFVKRPTGCSSRTVADSPSRPTIVPCSPIR